jgi:hypothetical protein
MQNGANNTPPEETKQYFEVHLDSSGGGFRGLPEDLELQLKQANFTTKQIQDHPA